MEAESLEQREPHASICKRKGMESLNQISQGSGQETGLQAPQGHITTAYT